MGGCILHGIKITEEHGRRPRSLLLLLYLLQTEERKDLLHPVDYIIVLPFLLLSITSSSSDTFFLIDYISNVFINWLTGYFIINNAFANIL